MVMKRDSGVRLTSIALLQKRFRQLQRMKELRQEKELLRVILSSSEYERHGAHLYELLRQKHEFSGSHLKSFPRCQLSLSLWPGSRNEGSTSPPQRVSASAVKLGSSCGCGGSDLDTSLRL